MLCGLISTEHTEESEKFDLLIGNREWMARNDLEVTKEMDVKMSVNENAGQTAVLCAVNGERSYIIESRFSYYTFTYWS